MADSDRPDWPCPFFPVPPLAAGMMVGVAALFGGLTMLSGCLADTSEGVGTSAPSNVRVADDPQEAVRRAAEVLVRSGSSRVGTTMEMVNGGTRFTIRGAGHFDYRRGRGRLEITLPDTVRGQRGPITELLVPGALYMRNRGVAVPHGSWVRVETASLADGNLVTGGATDPVSAAAVLRGATDVVELGEDTLDGVRVHRLRGVADLEVAARRAPVPLAGALRAAARSFTVTRVPFVVALDGQGRLREVRQEFTFHSASAVGGARRQVRVVSVTRLFGFDSGPGPSVELPDAEDIYPGKIVSPAVGRPARDPAR